MSTPAPAGSTRTRGRERGVAVMWDFRQPRKLSREHARVLEIAYDTFARHWTTLLASALRTKARVTAGPVEQRTYDEYVSELEATTVMALFGLDPLEGTGVLQLPLGVAMTSIDLALGGSGAGAQPERPLTEVETPLVLDLLERTLAELRYALAATMPLEAGTTTLELNPQFAQAAAASDLVVVARFDLEVGPATGTATLALPVTVLARRDEQESSTVRTEQALAREVARRAVGDQLDGVPVEVSVRFAGRPMRSADVLGLVVGDVLRLPHPVDRPLDVVAAGTVCARAVAGNRGTRLAALVVDPEETSR